MSAPYSVLPKLRRTPQPIYCDGWGRAVPKDVNSHSVVDYLFVRTVIFVPQEAQIVPVVLSHFETEEHLFDVGGDCDLLLPEAQ